jgi:hypothetical protein
MGHLKIAHYWSGGLSVPFFLGGENKSEEHRKCARDIECGVAAPETPRAMRHRPDLHHQRRMRRQECKPGLGVQQGHLRQGLHVGPRLLAAAASGGAVSSAISD